MPKNDVFSAEEKAAMRELVKERKRGSKTDGLADLQEKIAEMTPSDRALAKKVHAIVTKTAPDLSPKTWYGFPAYANADARTPEMQAAQAEWFERLDAGLAALPEEQRLAFVLVEMQGLSYQEAATIAEAGIGTLKSRLHRAKASLRELLRLVTTDKERAVVHRVREVE